MFCRLLVGMFGVTGAFQVSIDIRPEVIVELMIIAARRRQQERR